MGGACGTNGGKRQTYLLPTVFTFLFMFCRDFA
jgi:hypothetical protein